MICLIGNSKYAIKLINTCIDYVSTHNMDDSILSFCTINKQWIITNSNKKKKSKVNKYLDYDANSSSKVTSNSDTVTINSASKATSNSDTATINNTSTP